ncbi:MAG: hypothetical protein ABMA14_17615 [Hyphomonadaceae bacterium]
MTRKIRSAGPARFADRLRKVSAAPAAEAAYSVVGPQAERADRKASFRPATLTFITGDRVDVVVKNLSTTGARVEFMCNALLPDRVLLSEPTARLKVWAYVIWQDAGAAGLEFVMT